MNHTGEAVEELLVALAADEQTLSQRVEKRQQELSRAEKRLASIASVRPAYMDEYDRLQENLQELFTRYLDKLRNLEYLEHELEQYNRQREEVLQDSQRKLKKLQKKLREKELRILRGEHDIGGDRAQAPMAAIPEEDDSEAGSSS